MKSIIAPVKFYFLEHKRKVLVLYRKIDNPRQSTMALRKNIQSSMFFSSSLTNKRVFKRHFCLFHKRSRARHAIVSN